MRPPVGPAVVVHVLNVVPLGSGSKVDGQRCHKCQHKGVHRGQSGRCLAHLKRSVILIYLKMYIPNVAEDVEGGQIESAASAVHLLHHGVSDGQAAHEEKGVHQSTA